ncbi:MAG TPA: alkaline phosphatase, partial [Candidatus Rifleibacterium sp.]|nr:alkaline phosphatase [Candidatus Rifleibacterium sp.]
QLIAQAQARFVGDGMGVAHITAARIENGPLNLERFKIMGLHMTGSANDYVTDSAAAGTALATGFKTNNDVVGQSPDGKPLKNLMEYAREAGKATGVTVTSILPHATPAAFSAHHIARYHYDTITEQQANSGLDVMIGGGLSNYYPKTTPGSRRKDDKHILNLLREKMPVVLSIATLRKIKAPKQLTAILSAGHLPPAIKRDYTLGELTAKALECLTQNEKGFALMVEGSQIDLASHDNDMPRLIGEVKDFDTAVKTSLDFAEKDGSTLVVVTADHETGGITLPMKTIENDKIVKPTFSSDNHTAVMVPVFAYGPGAEKFAGIQAIDDVGRKLIELVK